MFNYASFIEDLDYEPSSIMVIGGSKVAIEYASFYRATGTPTTIVSRGALLATGGPGRMDHDLRRFAVDGMRTRGVELLEHSTAVRVTGTRHVEAVEVATPGGPRWIEADFVLLATGEQPNVESFIGALPVARNADGFVNVDSRMRTSIPHVYAAGTCSVRRWRCSSPVAAAPRRLGHHGHGQRVPLHRHPGLPAYTYEVTWAGLSEGEARKKFGDVVTIQIPPPTWRRAIRCCRWHRGR